MDKKELRRMLESREEQVDKLMTQLMCTKTALDNECIYRQREAKGREEFETKYKELLYENIELLEKIRALLKEQNNG